MKTNTLQTKWLIDGFLFAGYLLSFFLDWTGLFLHQLLGVAVGILAMYHLLAHWKWVSTATRRFFGRTSSQARRYYLIDLGMLIGFFTIGITGLTISSWLNLSLAAYASWRQAHILASILVLLMILAKLGLHSRWIMATARRVIFHQPEISGNLQPGRQENSLARRDFLKIIGVTGAASLVAFMKAVNSIQADSLTESGTDIITSPSATGQDNLVSGFETAEDEIVRQPTATTDVLSDSAASCLVKCNRKCSYPGHCRKYVDSNHNNRCDWGECAG